jgi:hypothetical protein
VQPDKLGPTARFAHVCINQHREFASAPEFLDPTRFRDRQIELGVDYDPAMKQGDD